MGIAYHALKVIAPHLKAARVLSLGYPDLLISPAQCMELFGIVPTQSPQSIIRHAQESLPDTAKLFAHVCASFDCVDVAQFAGCERVADLNLPHALGEYDLVLDPGTLEHCFNVGQAMMNAANAVAVGGRILHLSPVTMVNHGFWNFCPTLFHDFYVQNGWKIERFEAMEKKADGEYVGNMVGHETKRLRMAQETGVLVLSQRLTASPLRYPVQEKYRADFEKRMVA